MLTRHSLFTLVAFHLLPVVAFSLLFFFVPTKAKRAFEKEKMSE